MSKTLWHTIQIKVPAEMVELTKSGKISIKKTLTKTFNISRSQKKQAIKLIPANVNHPSIINEGKEWDVNELKLRMAKAKALQMKNKEKDIFKRPAKKIKNHDEYIKTLTHFRKLEQIVVDGANGDKQKQHSLTKKYLSKIIKLQGLLNGYDMKSTRTGFHTFLYEPKQDKQTIFPRKGKK